MQHTYWANTLHFYEAMSWDYYIIHTECNGAIFTKPSSRTISHYTLHSTIKYCSFSMTDLNVTPHVKSGDIAHFTVFRYLAIYFVSFFIRVNKFWPLNIHKVSNFASIFFKFSATVVNKACIHSEHSIFMIYALSTLWILF